ncbi:unnamed protein product [Pleuronectes platessa]|uniref:Uncharacterized protein n=1 Tax=Pleuronectes platessa TaxID=8262 RepID=A0A9N7ZD28_PLEPL|nr:unnamed protein product [Pleuronectes platessa]
MPPELMTCPTECVSLDCLGLVPQGWHGDSETASLAHSVPSCLSRLPPTHPLSKLLPSYADYEDDWAPITSQSLNERFGEMTSEGQSQSPPPPAAWAGLSHYCEDSPSIQGNEFIRAMETDLNRHEGAL